MLCPHELFVTPWTAARQASLSFTISRSLLKLTSIELVMPSNHLILCCPLLLLPSIFLSISVFFNESALHIGWLNSWNFSFNISPSNEYSGLISFRIWKSWFDLLAVQRTVNSLFQHHNLKASVLWCSAFLMVQLSHPYVTTGKAVALTIWTFVGKVRSLLLMCCHNFPSKEQASFNFMAAVTVCSNFGTQENKICHCFHFFPFYLSWSGETEYHDLSFLNVEFQASFFTVLFSLIKRIFNSSSLSAVKVVSSADLRLLIFLLAILIPACDSSSPAFYTMPKNVQIIAKLYLFHILAR